VQIHQQRRLLSRQTATSRSITAIRRASALAQHPIEPDVRGLRCQSRIVERGQFGVGTWAASRARRSWLRASDQAGHQKAASMRPGPAGAPLGHKRRRGRRRQRTPGECHGLTTGPARRSKMLHVLAGQGLKHRAKGRIAGAEHQLAGPHQPPFAARIGVIDSADQRDGPGLLQRPPLLGFSQTSAPSPREADTNSCFSSSPLAFVISAPQVGRPGRSRARR